MNKTELLKKIKILAEQGVSGEAENAESILARLLDKYGISEDELSEETRGHAEFKFSGKEQETLLLQIIYKVTNGNMAYHLIFTKTRRKCRNVLGAECTHAEKVEVEYLFDFYKRLWEREKAAFLSAFIQKHKIFAMGPDIEPTEATEEEIVKMVTLMNGMDDDTPHKAIEAPK